MKVSTILKPLVLGSLSLLCTSQAFASFTDNDAISASYRHYPKTQTDLVFNKEVLDSKNIFNKGADNSILHWKATKSDSKKSSASMMSRQGSKSGITTVTGKIYFPQQTMGTELNISFTFNDPKNNKGYEKGVFLSNLDKEKNVRSELTEKVVDIKLIINNSNTGIASEENGKSIRIKAKSYQLILNGEKHSGRSISADAPINAPIQLIRLKSFSMGGLEFYLDDFGMFDGLK
jgi:hypothetical protein